MIDHENRMDITLVGSGFLGCYYFGAFCLLRQVWPERPFAKIRGCSSGGIMAASAASNLSLVTIAASFGQFTVRVKKLMMRLGVGRTLTDLVRVMIAELLPDNAHELASGRIDINLTRFWDFQNVKACHFETKQTLVDAVVAGAFIPFWSGTIIPPVYKGVRYIDGGWAFHQPTEGDNGTTVDKTDDIAAQGVSSTGCARETGELRLIFCPYSGENLDVCPPDRSSSFAVPWFGVRMNLNWKNFVRMFNSFVPRHSSVYEQYIVGGHSDMKRCLLDNCHNLLRCKQCRERDSTGPLGCLRCLLLVEKVDNLRLPDEILNAYHSAARAKSD